MKRQPSFFVLVVVLPSVLFTLSPRAGSAQQITSAGMIGPQAATGSALTGQPLDGLPDLANGAEGTRESSGTPWIAPASSGGLVIHATFDGSITSDPNAAAIQAMINQAIGIYQSLFTDPITIEILFRYSMTGPDGGALDSGNLARSNYVIYKIPWNTYINALRADAKTARDATANATLPSSSLSTRLVVSAANGRAVGLNTPPGMNSSAMVGTGPGFVYDGIVTLNSAAGFRFTRPTAPSSYDALRSTEHEIDEVLGLGSYLPDAGDLRPQDLFSWSSSGIRNLVSTGSRYFSVDNGVNSLVDFSQNSNGDFGDWLSAPCPQSNPYVQNAFSCRNQFADVTAASPEGINLDVIGYDLSSSHVKLRRRPSG